MTRDELIEKLRDLAIESDREVAHIEADKLLLEYINDDEVSEVFNSQEMWTA